VARLPWKGLVDQFSKKAFAALFLSLSQVREETMDVMPTQDRLSASAWFVLI
jgi:hypothetical protein